MPEHGPFQTEADASRTSAVRAIHAAFDADPGAGKMCPLNYRMLLDACDAAGVVLGDFDRGVLAWLANWEPQTCAVIAGIIRRAGQLPEGTVTEWGVRAPLDQDVYATPDEAEARRIAGHYWDARVVSRQVTPWTEVPAPETAEEDGDDA